MKICIITAMPEETRAVIRALPQPHKTVSGGHVRYQGRLSGHEIVVAESGMGFANATEAARQLIAELRPDLMVSAGLCGGIAAELRVGDAVLAAGLVIVSDGGVIEVPVTFSPLGSEFLSRHAGGHPRPVAGLFVTTRAIMRKEHLAALLPAGAHHPVVEMESAAIALVAGENGIPFLGLRTVSDPREEELDFALDEFCDTQMRIRIPRVLMTVARKPRIIPQLIRLARNSRIAAESLSRAMKSILEHL